jgi:large subunit ribosomal protein L4
MKAAALRYVISDRANAGRVHVVDFGIADKPSTKTANAVLLQVAENRFSTVVLSRENVNEWLSVRNIPTVHVIFADQLNTYDVVTAEDLVFSKEGLAAFVEAKTGSKTESAKEA